MAQKKKDLNFEIPNSIFNFHPNEIKDSYVLLPVFQDTTNEELQSILNINQAIFHEELFFSKKLGEIYQTANFIFLGLGEKKKFHPENIINVFKALGNYLTLSGPTKITIKIPLYLEEVLLNWVNLYKENKNDPWNRKDQTKTTSDNIYFDYVSDYNLEELIKTMIYSIELGGFSLAIYKNQKNQKKSRVEIGFDTSIKTKDLSKIIDEAKKCFSFNECISLYCIITC